MLLYILSASTTTMERSPSPHTQTELCDFIFENLELMPKVIHFIDEKEDFKKSGLDQILKNEKILNAISAQYKFFFKAHIIKVVCQNFRFGLENEEGYKEMCVQKILEFIGTPENKDFIRNIFLRLMEIDSQNITHLWENIIDFEMHKACDEQNQLLQNLKNIVKSKKSFDLFLEKESNLLVQLSLFSPSSQVFSPIPSSTSSTSSDE